MCMDYTVSYTSKKPKHSKICVKKNSLFFNFFQLWDGCFSLPVFYIYLYSSITLHICLYLCISITIDVIVKFWGREIYSFLID